MLCLASSVSAALAPAAISPAWAGGGDQSADRHAAARHDRHALEWTGYDDAIRRAWRNQVPEVSDWRWFKAQLYQESGLDTYAVSGVGAAGLCQAMPATFKDWARDLKWGDADPHVARYCIEGGAYYMGQLIRFPDWRFCPFPDRLQLSQGGYNAGPGNIRKAVGLADDLGGRCSWAAVALALPAITGHRNARQTTDYILLIDAWYTRLTARAPATVVIVCRWVGHAGGCGARMGEVLE